jgi:hypothetical protein
MGNHRENDENFSPTWADGLKRADSDKSWTSSQEEKEQELSNVDRSKLFLVSLGALMSLFR